MKTLNISSVLAIILMFSPINGFGEDPLSESFIINSLEMETDILPSEKEDKKTSGEVIFDDTFEYTPGGKARQKKSSANLLQELKSEDSRWHLNNYRVKKNENIWCIAKKFGISHSRIIKINNLKDPNRIKAGQILKIPSKRGVTYKIRRGDTLGGISIKYKIDVKKIVRHNNLPGNKIIAGKKIFLPDAVEIVKSNKTGTTGYVNKRSVAVKTKRHETSLESRLILSWPLKGPITSGFGYRNHPFTGKRKFHCGLDIGANIDTEIHASGDGKVIFSGWKGPYGNMIVLAHDKSYITVYAHNSKHLVKAGDHVERGDIIALSGKTGAVTGAHLHFEIRKGITPLNPLRILKK